MEKNFALGVLLSAVALFGFSLLQVNAQIRSRGEVFTDVTEYLSTVSDSIFQVNPKWPQDMKDNLDEIVAGLNKWKESASGEASRMDQPSFLLHR